MKQDACGGKVDPSCLEKGNTEGRTCYCIRSMNNNGKCMREIEISINTNSDMVLMIQ